MMQERRGAGGLKYSRLTRCSVLRLLVWVEPERYAQLNKTVSNRRNASTSVGPRPQATVRSVSLPLAQPLPDTPDTSRGATRHTHVVLLRSDSVPHASFRDFKPTKPRGTIWRTTRTTSMRSSGSRGSTCTCSRRTAESRPSSCHKTTIVFGVPTGSSASNRSGSSNALWHCERRTKVVDR